MNKHKLTHDKVHNNRRLDEFGIHNPLTVNQSIEISKQKLKGKNKMVERTQSNAFDEFEGVVQDVKFDAKGQHGKQYHIEIKPSNVEIKGETGLIHEWINLPETATEKSVPEDSVADRYLQQIEILHKDAKKKETVSEAFLLLKDNKYLFKKVKHGKSFDGHNAKEYWTPVKQI